MDKKLGIIGIGNPFRGDDGIGLHLIQQIDKKQWGAGVDIIDGGIGGMNLYHIIASFGVVLLVDAVDFNSAPGESCFFSSKDITSSHKKGGKTSTHITDICKVINMICQFHTNPPIIYVFGIQPKTVILSDSLSREVQNKIPLLVDQLTSKIHWIIEHES